MSDTGVGIVVLRLSLGVALLLAGGCATAPYRFRTPGAADGKPAFGPGLQVERGQSNIVVDTVGLVFSIPSKIILWNMKVDSHSVSAETEGVLTNYLCRNSLSVPKVRLNEYAPLDECSRLFANERVGIGWRCTFGVLSMVFYTLLPERIFGGDNYNPWTDTINIYSDHPAIVVHEAAHARDFAEREYPGTYGFFYMLPFVALYHEGRASSDALSYFMALDQREELRDAYKILYPAYATYVGGIFDQFSPSMGWVTYVAVVPGHILGRIKAREVPDKEPAAP